MKWCVITHPTFTDANGEVQWKGTYDPYGNLTIKVNNLKQSQRFPGQRNNPETGLYYNYFRDYDPEIRRYLQSDPIGLNGGINTYGFVGGNPVNAIDPLGLEIVGVWGHKGLPAIYDFNHIWGDARRPEGWWKFWKHGGTFRSGEFAFNVRVGFDWNVKCKDTCNDEEWEIDGGTSKEFKVYVPLFTPIHPSASKYTTLANGSYNLLLKPAFNGSLEKAAVWARMFYSTWTATQICKTFPRY